MQSNIVNEYLIPPERPWPALTPSSFSSEAKLIAHRSRSSSQARSGKYHLAGRLSVHQALRASVQATILAAEVVLPDLATQLFVTFADSQENPTTTYVPFSADIVCATFLTSLSLPLTLLRCDLAEAAASARLRRDQSSPRGEHLSRCTSSLVWG